MAISDGGDSDSPGMKTRKEEPKVSESEVLEMISDILESVASLGNSNLIQNIPQVVQGGDLGDKIFVNFVEVLLRQRKEKELIAFLEKMWDRFDWPDDTIIETTTQKLVKLLLGYYTSAPGKKIPEVVFLVLGALHDMAIEEIMRDVPDSTQKTQILKGIANNLSDV